MFKYCLYCSILLFIHIDKQICSTSTYPQETELVW